IVDVPEHRAGDGASEIGGAAGDVDGAKQAGEAGGDRRGCQKYGADEYFLHFRVLLSLELDAASFFASCSKLRRPRKAGATALQLLPCGCLTSFSSPALCPGLWRG